MRKLAALLLVLMMTTVGAALAELNWPRLTTMGQEQLQAYIGRVNENLLAQGQGTVNAIFEMYETFATMGITASDGADVPEDVEMTFLMGADGLGTLQLRVSDAGRFQPVAAACIAASSPTAITLDTALAEASAYVQRTQAAPYTRFEDAVDTMQGLAPRVYYAYYPNQYSDGVNWWQVTLVFPLPGSEDAPLAAVFSPDATQDIDRNELFSMNTNTFEEEYDHLEVFVTETPEPDSAVHKW